MGIVSFFKEAGERLFGHKATEAVAAQAQSAPGNAALQVASAAANQTAAGSRCCSSAAAYWFPGVKGRQTTA